MINTKATIKCLDYFSERAYNIKNDDTVYFPVIHNESILKKNLMITTFLYDVIEYCEKTYNAIDHDTSDSSTKISYNGGWWIHDSWINNY